MIPDLTDRTPHRLTGAEHLREGAKRLPHDLRDFWQWSSSDLLSNALRGVFAEWLVATALDASDGVREEWAEHDVTTHSGIKIEVKSSAYLQSWHQKKLSAISFDISPAKSLDPENAFYYGEPRRHADVYVFCLLGHTNKSSVNPLDLDQWTFYVLPTATLDQNVAKQKKLSLAALRQLEPVETKWSELARTIEAQYPPSHS